MNSYSCVFSLFCVFRKVIRGKNEEIRNEKKQRQGK